ncbi:MAG: PAS domain S-box protein [Candidatus Hydrogenedentes bacterium]|nr:PAS domain S-box protein [Candidatus Hydrogenedentota bacterium]
MFHHVRRYFPGRETWLAILTFVLIAASVTALWRESERGEKERIRIETEVTAGQVRLRLEAWIDTRVAIIQYLGNTYSFGHEKSSQAFRDEAIPFLGMYPGFQALNWIDSDWVIRIIVPEEGNEPALNKDLHVHPEAGVPLALAKAIETGQASRSPAIQLLQGGRGFAVYQPVHDTENRLVGFLNGVFRIDTLVNACLSESDLRDRFRFDFLQADGQPIYEHHTEAHPHDWPYQAMIPVRVVDRPWTLQIAPSPEFLEESLTAVDEITLVTGLVLATIIAWLLRIFLFRNKRLGEREAEYRTLVECLPAITYTATLDAASTTLYVSPQVENLLGFSQLDYRNKPGIWCEQLHPEDRERVLQELAHVQSSGTPAALEYRMITADGGVVWLRDEAAIVCDLAGKPIHIQGVMVDITERKRAEEALRFTQFAVDHTLDSAFWMRKDGQFIYVNQAAIRSLGYTQAQLLSMTIHDIVPDSSRDSWSSSWGELRQRGQLVFESLYRTKEGVTFPVMITANLVEFEGEE